MKSSLERSVFTLLSPVLANEAIELVDVEYEEAGNRKTLRLLIHRSSGVTSGDCQRVSQIVSPILDVYSTIEGKYRLEVASPGVDRPLVTEADFRRNLGRQIQIEVSTPTTDPSRLDGTLKKVDQGEIFLCQMSGKTVQIMISEIKRAQIQLAW